MQNKTKNTWNPEESRPEPTNTMLDTLFIRTWMLTCNLSPKRTSTYWKDGSKENTTAQLRSYRPKARDLVLLPVQLFQQAHLSANMLEMWCQCRSRWPSLKRNMPFNWAMGHQRRRSSLSALSSIGPWAISSTTLLKSKQIYEVAGSWLQMALWLLWLPRNTSMLESRWPTATMAARITTRLKDSFDFMLKLIVVCIYWASEIMIVYIFYVF